MYLGMSSVDIGVDSARPEGRRRFTWLVETLASLSGTRALVVTTSVYAAVFSAVAVLRHAAFETRRFDLGNMTQAVWSTAHGHPLETTAATGQQFDRLGVHVDPLLAAFALPWRLWPSPVMLLVAQVVLVSLGSIPVYWLARKYLGSERTAFRFGVAYLLYPATQWNALNDFHPTSLGIPFLLFAIWYLDEGRLLPFVAFAVLTGLTKESKPPLLAALGIWYAVRRGRRGVGAAIAAGGIAWFAVDLFLVIPHFAPAHTNLVANRYASVGGSPGGILETLAAHPGRILDKLASPNSVVFLLVLLLPFAGLSLREPLLAACAAPVVLLDLLSDKAAQTSIAEHYTSGIVPFVVASAVIGAAGLRGQAARWTTVAVTACALSGLYSPVGMAFDYVREIGSPLGAARRDAVSVVPAGAAVAATNRLGGHLSARRRILSVPAIAGAGWIAVDVHDPTLGDEPDPAGFRRFLASVESDRRWTRVFDRDGVLVFRRSSAEGRSPR